MQRTIKTQPTEAVTEMKIDNKVLNEIEEAVLELRRTDYWSIGCQIRKHVDSSLDGLYDPEAIAQSIHRDCKVMFRRVERYDRDLDKLDKVKNEIRNMKYFYLGIH
jgi:hypothetical protein